MKTKGKHYLESVEVMDYIAKHVPKQKDSEWIRKATAALMKKELAAYISGFRGKQ